jgi:hypothetical protein
MIRRAFTPVTTYTGYSVRNGINSGTDRIRADWRCAAAEGVKASG